MDAAMFRIIVAFILLEKVGFSMPYWRSDFIIPPETLQNPPLSFRSTLDVCPMSVCLQPGLQISFVSTLFLLFGLFTSLSAFSMYLCYCNIFKYSSSLTHTHTHTYMKYILITVSSLSHFYIWGAYYSVTAGKVNHSGSHLIWCCLMISISGCAGDTLSLDWYFFHRKRTQGKNHHLEDRTIYGTFLNLQMLFLSSLYFNPGIKKLWTQGFDYLTLPDTYIMRMIASKHRSEIERVRPSHPLLQENIPFTFLGYIFGQFRFMIDFDTLRKVPKIFMIISGTWCVQV